MNANNNLVKEVSFIRINRDNASESLNRDNCHDRYEIVYAVSAHGRYRIEGREFLISPNTLILIKPFAYHLVEIEDVNFEICSLQFTRKALSEKLINMLDDICRDERGHYYPPKSISSAILSTFDRFEIAESLGDEAGEEYTKALLCEIVALLSATNGEEISKTENELGARVTEYLNRNIERNLSLDKLAKKFFVSKYHLCRAFKSYSGISVHSYINHKRIMYAKQLIESGVSASGAAERVGFGDYSAFYRAYVRIVGKSPSTN